MTDLLIIAIPVLPLVAFLVNGLAGSRYSHDVAGRIACSSVGLSFAAALVVFADQLQTGVVREVVAYRWIFGGDLTINLAFLIDPLTCIMLLVVTGVGFLIHLYSIGYMHGEEGFTRFFTYMNLFMVSMLLLVMGNNYVVLFIGWEGVGLCSYLLIGYYYDKVSAAKAATKAFVVNRIGDAGFLLAIFLVFYNFGTLDYTQVFAKAGALSPKMATAIALCLLVGAVGKSAQIPLYTWLPDAMEGPTPVSALIHAATMVTAGVYMIARNHAIYDLSPVAMTTVAVVGGSTALFAATIGLVQNDIKRVLAYSTVSQLGYMFLGCGIGAYAAAIFHLMTHAFFKALLFLSAGSVIHALGGEQDIRRMGGLRKKIPWTHAVFLIGTLAIAGIFPLAGFFSKDEILWKAFTREEDFFFKALWGVGLITALMTAFYMFRLVFLTFFGKSRVAHEVEHHVHEAPRSMTVPLMVLALGSVIAGWVGWPAALGGGNWFEHFLHPVFASRVEAEAVEHPHALELGLMVVSLAVAGAGIWLAYQFYLKRTELPDLVASKLGAIYQLVYNKYYVDEIYSKVFVEGPILGKGMGTAFAVFDQKVIDGMGVDGSAWTTRVVSRVSIWWDTWIVDGSVNLLGWAVWVLNLPARAVQTGSVQRYALWMAAGIVLLLFYYVERYWSLLFGS